LDLSNGFTWVIPFSVLGASLLGSPHCVMMCGPLAANFATQSKDPQLNSRMWAYQIGRGISYMTLGALAGAFGRGVFSLIQVPWAMAASLFVIGLSLLVLGYRAFRGESLHMRLPKPVLKITSGLWRKLHLARLSPQTTAGLSGVLTVFLPCGHLYAFVLGAMAMGSPLEGAVFMLAFWLGTVPALGLGTRWLVAWIQPKLGQRKTWAGVILIAAGLFSLGSFAARIPHLPAIVKKGESAAASKMSHEAPTSEIEAAKGLKCH
jgi:uncharacterized protein